MAWQRFLDELPAGGLTEQSQQGLFAELWFLQRGDAAGDWSRKAVRAWAGPKQLGKGLSVGGLAFEVKASSAKQHARFTISSELQLDTRASNASSFTAFFSERLRGRRHVAVRSLCSCYAPTCRAILRPRRSSLNCCFRWATPTRTLQVHKSVRCSIAAFLRRDGRFSTDRRRGPSAWRRRRSLLDHAVRVRTLLPDRGSMRGG